jgi:hypothetical protein
MDVKHRANNPRPLETPKRTRGRPRKHPAPGASQERNEGNEKPTQEPAPGASQERNEGNEKVAQEPAPGASQERNEGNEKPTQEPAPGASQERTEGNEKAETVEDFSIPKADRYRKIRRQMHEMAETCADSFEGGIQSLLELSRENGYPFTRDTVWVKHRVCTSDGSTRRETLTLERALAVSAAEILGAITPSDFELHPGLSSLVGLSIAIVSIGSVTLGRRAVGEVKRQAARPVAVDEDGRVTVGSLEVLDGRRG